ncbi:hypothetical protein RN001_001915 [Aquatica leii]|uniref:Uncharacterized protein n=1 Tax=Aquatica leii TaxID=1421715 RepID=A0AAN7SLJ8_9COLE|nr:hypothetical protein RN001_001915 [Aquatica leii]
MSRNISVHHNLEKLNHDTWKDIVLNSQIHLDYVNQTYDILYMVEKTENASNAVAKFYYGAKIDPLNAVKPVAYEEIVQNIREFSDTPLPGDKTAEMLYNMAAKESVSYMNRYRTLPCSWMAVLIKLHIMFLLEKDVTKAYQNVLNAKDLQLSQLTLLEGDKKLKIKNDPCDYSFVSYFKTTSTLKPILRRSAVRPEPLQVPPKHMFFVIIGFYDYELFKELFIIKVPVTGFIELMEPDSNDVCSACDCVDCGNDEEFSSIKEKVLFNFWDKFYKFFEAEDYLECFDKTFHMTIQTFADALKNGNSDNKLCFEVFINIGSEIVKVLDIQRLYVLYIRNLKMCNVTSDSEHVPIQNYSIYNNIFNLLPPECFSVPTVVDAMLEQLDHVTLNSSCNNSSIFRKRSSALEVPKIHLGIRNCIVDVLSQNLSSKCFLQNTAEETNSKICLTITRNEFLVDANNSNYIKASPYEYIRVEYLERNQHLLEKCYSALLWRKYCLPEQIRLLNCKYHLNNVAQDIDASMQEVQYIVHAILLNSIKCLGQIPLVQNTSLGSIFPPLKTPIPKLIQFQAHIKNEPKSIQVDSLNELTANAPDLVYSNNPNIYESKNIENYKWYEKLSTEVMVQELYKAEKCYGCLDYKYCAFDDSILLRFHNNLDNFGINRKTWNQSLRTYVDLKEFCKYVVYEDSRWLENQEKKYEREFEDEYKKNAKFEENMKDKFYPKLLFSDADFIQPGSFKARKLTTRSSVLESCSKNVMTSRSKVGIGSGLSVLEKLALPTELPVRQKRSVHYAKSPPYSFFAYDLSQKRIHLTGSTIVFCSQDGVKVTVDQTRFTRQPNNMSINITADEHSLILHKNDRTWLEPFTFHFCLPDDTIIAFAKPYKACNPEEKLSESIYRALNNSNQNKRQNLYFVSDRQNYVLKCFNIPFVTKKQLILSEEMLPLFLNYINKKGIPLKLVSSEQSLSIEGSGDLETILKGSLRSVRSSYKSAEGKSPRFSKSSSVDKKHKLNTRYEIKLSKKLECQSIFKAQCFKGNDEKENLKENVYKENSYNKIEPHDNIRKLVDYEEVPVFKKSNAKLITEIQKAMESQLPIFKICSSKLHRSQYVKRVKSYIEIPIGPILKRISVKPRLQPTKRQIHISKVLPIKPLIIRNYLKYELKLCLPSGLCVESIAGFDNDPFCVRQTYTDKGPQCKNIAYEVSRTYMRNGTVLVKKVDGNFVILYINGQIVNCNLPNYHEKLNCEEKRESTRKVKVGYSLSNLTYLHAFGSNSANFKKYLQRVLHRLDKHVIGKAKTNTFTSYGKCKSKTFGVPSDMIYLLQTSVAPFTKFSLVTTDGKKLKVTKTAVMKRKKFYTSVTKEYRYEEFLFDREDGTHMLFNRESELFIQFPDGTRISSFIHIQDNLVYFPEEEDESECPFSKKTSTCWRSSSEQFQDKNGWVFINLTFRFEHPNYGTVIFDGATQNAEIVLPGNLNIHISKVGEYNLEISKKISATVTTSTLIFESQLCNTCLQKCVATLNVKPLYDKIKNMVNSSSVELLQVSDSFNKKFVLNFDGQCYNNTDYINGRYNSVHCPIHNPFEYHKLFVLKRDLNGCKFWDVALYRNMIKRATDENKTVLKFHGSKTFQMYFSTTFKTPVYKPVDEKYLLPYDQPYLVMTISKPDATEVFKHLYTQRQIFKALPTLRKITCIYKTLLKHGREKNIDEIVSNKELTAFIANLLLQSVEENEKSKVQQEKLEIQMAVEAEMVPPVPLAERWRKWRQEVHMHLTKIRNKYVPLYSASKLRENLMQESAPLESVVTLLAPCTETKIEIMPSMSNIEIDNGSILSDEVENLNEGIVRSIAESTHEMIPPSIENIENLNQSTQLETEFLENIENFKVIAKTKKEELFEIPLAIEILHELILRFASFIKYVVVDDYYTSSDSKVQYVAEKIYSNIVRASKDLNEVEEEDLINVASKILVDNICLEQLNPLEMHSLLEKFISVKKDESICNNNKLSDCLEKCKQTQETKVKIESKVNTDNADSAYKLYSAYGVRNYFTESNNVSTFSPRKRSLTIVYEAPSETDRSTTQLLPEKNKFLLRSSYTNLLQQQSVGSFCQKCIDKSDFFKELEVKKDELWNLSTSSVINESAKNCSTSGSNALTPHISQDSMVDSVNENVTTIDSHTHLLDKYNFIPPESMRVLFSVVSLKGKDVENAGPYVERRPNLIEKNFTRLTESLSQDNSNDDLEVFNHYDVCSRCILKQTNFNDTDIAGLSNGQSIQGIFKHNKSENLLPFTNKEMENSSTTLLETLTNICEKDRGYKTHVIAKVGDGDMHYLASDCPPAHDPALHVKEHTKADLRKVIRKSVGMVTQPDTMDHITQT